MAVLKFLYWVAALGVVYPYVIYPAWLAVRARWRPRPVRRGRRGDGSLPSVSVVLAAYNEAASIARRVGEFAARIDAAGLDGEVVVVSDGSTDGTADAVRGLQPRASVPVRVVELPGNIGKAAALTAGCCAAQHEVVALGDARQVWADDALERLLENFDDPEVGAVSGELIVESAPGVMGGVGLYWRYEKWLRRREALVHSTVGVTGAICAVRRGLFSAIPAGTILDDVYWPLCVTMRGYRVVFDSSARAYDRLPERVGDEFRRKVRTLGGNFQLVARLPEALLPWRCPVWFALVSHKLARLAVPWLLLATLLISAVLGGPLYSALFVAQALATLVVLAGLVPALASRSRLTAAGASFFVLNAAAWIGFWVWATGRASRSWTKTVYAAPPVVAVGVVS